MGQYTYVIGELAKLRERVQALEDAQALAQPVNQVAPAKAPAKASAAKAPAPSE